MKYRENLQDSKEYKQAYLDGLEKLIEARQREAEKKREAYCKNIFANGEFYRDDFKRMLGWPLTDHEKEEPPVPHTVKLADEDGYSIYRMTFPVLDGLHMSGLYFEMHGAEKKPLVLVQHGGLGTPEHIAGLYGSTTNYNQMLERVIAQGVHAFAPQLLLWKEEQYGVAYGRKEIDARLKRVGSSITAVELYGLMRILDYFETKETVSNFGMVGLSYGGFYTLYLSAVDTRIRSAISCSFFNTRDRYPWCDWTWQRSAQMFDDAEIACLVYPRKLCIEIGTRDELFDAAHGIRSYEKLMKLSEEVGTDWLTFIPFDGTHEFCKDNEPIACLVRDISEGNI
jgi:dienelactone hydrolase